MGPLLPILWGAGEGIKALLGLRGAAKDRESQEKLTKQKLDQDLTIAKMDDARTRELAGNDLALEESKLDPFRALLAQVGAAQQLDRLASYEPLDLDFSASRPGSFAPVARGGAQAYRPSDDVRAAATTARTAALTGQGANPSVSNRDQAQALLNLLAQLPPAKGPVNSTMPVGRPPQQMAVLPDIDNRMMAAQSPDDFRLSFDDTMRPAPASRVRRLRSPRRGPVAA